MEKNKFFLSEAVMETSLPAVRTSPMDFSSLCNYIKHSIDGELRSQSSNLEAAMRIQKRALLGYPEEVAGFIDRISAIVEELNCQGCVYPTWYQSLEEGIFHEIYGLAGMAEWFSEALLTSSSAKVIGSRIYFLENGSMRLKPQRISQERREQLIRAFLLGSPEERVDSKTHEIYLMDGTRVTIFKGSMTKAGEDIMVFRRFLVPRLTFEDQAALGTIPPESVGFFKRMVKLGYNVAITGAVRSSKSSFLTTWQSYENPELEGVMIETDPEIPMHEIMPAAPVLQLLADGEDLLAIVKSVLRSDADYFIIAEARDGVALDTAVKIASKGNRRLKITFHEREPCSFCDDAAAEIVKSLGGDLSLAARSVAKSFDYIFHFIQLKDKRQKRLSAIYEIHFDYELRRVVYYPVCLYDLHGGGWKWYCHISPEKEKAGLDEDVEAYCDFSNMLREFAGGDEGEAVIRAC